MNTNALKKFAQEARRKLLEQVGAKLEYVLNTDTPELREKADQVQKLREAIQSSTKEQIIDKVTYTWFNRFMALRFMDANDYQPIGIRVLTPKDGFTLPELLDEAKQGHIPEELSVKNQRIYDLLDSKIPSNNAQNEAYKDLLIGACNHLNKVFPFLFERINDYTELLLPDDLTSELSIIQDIRDGMSIEDCTEVEVIGWLYQFYISEKKDEVFASKSAVKKEDIPAATQLFTPRWIVEYMVQNTVGKLWLQNKPNSKLREYMPYFIESPSVTNEDYLKLNSIEELTLLDQACGSGHILVYGFELFYKIYEEEGYNTNEIPELIIKNNLFGFEIDERASQLAGMALMMKARSYNRRFFRKEVEPTILCYKDLVLTKEEYTEAFNQIGINLFDELNYDLTQMQQATNYGSLIALQTSTQELEKVLAVIVAKENTTDAFLKYQLEHLKISVEQLIHLSKKYHCIVDNPPYMGGGNMNNVLGDFVKINYPDSKADLMTCFMEAGCNMLLPKGILGMINLPSWLFLSSFEKLREKLIKEKHIDSLLHMGRGIFGVDWGSTAFIIQNQQIDKISKYFKLHKRNFQHLYPEDIQQIFLKAKNNPSTKINFDKYREGDGITSVDELVDEAGLQISYTTSQKDFEKIPGSPIGYWVNKSLLNIFNDSHELISISRPCQGMATTNNKLFVRDWHEVNFCKIDFDSKDIADFSNKKWFPYNKGGGYRRWYGNHEDIVNFENSGKTICDYIDNTPNVNVKSNGRVINKDKYFKSCISWSKISSGIISMRYYPDGFTFDVAGCSIFGEEKFLMRLLGFVNSQLSIDIFSIFSPTLNYEVGQVNKLPIHPKLLVENSFLENAVSDIIKIYKSDWDSQENSWEFKKVEFEFNFNFSLIESFDYYLEKIKNRYNTAFDLENIINKTIYEIYEIEFHDDFLIKKEHISLIYTPSSINYFSLVEDFISYSVACMFGRFSLNMEGLILANQEETLEDYLAKVALTKEQLSFIPDEDNIIPVLDDEWFEDDITGRFYAFLKASFGSANFDKNLAFIEECLGKDVRKYFVKDFYNDHIKRYKKRPIYWMFSSPKGSFNVLIYMHRYTPDTLNKILNGYLIEYREKLNTRMEHLHHLIVSGSSTEQTKAQKEKDKLKLVLIELQEYERETLRPLAIERINIDLDEGVLVNYNKFGKAIKDVAGLNDAKTKKKVKEFDWIDVTQII